MACGRWTRFNDDLRRSRRARNDRTGDHCCSFTLGDPRRRALHPTGHVPLSDRHQQRAAIHLCPRLDGRRVLHLARGHRRRHDRRGRTDHRRSGPGRCRSSFRRVGEPRPPHQDSGSAQRLISLWAAGRQARLRSGRWDNHPDVAFPKALFNSTTQTSSPNASQSSLSQTNAESMTFDRCAGSAVTPQYGQIGARLTPESSFTAPSSRASATRTVRSTRATLPRGREH